MRRLFRARYLAPVVAIVVLAATGVLVFQASSNPVDPDVTAPPQPALAPYYQQQLVLWKDCGHGLQCATVQVPLDYAKPEGERIDLAVNRKKATGDRIGSLLVNPGGPGASGLEVVEQMASMMDRKVRERFDVVGFDPRGVGKSSPVRCLDPQDWQDSKLRGADEKDEPAVADDWREFSGKCAQKSGKLLPHIGTENAARDLDVLRAVLGDRQLTYLGWSYGSELGATYASLFPGRVRALVLDGAVDPDAPPVEFELAQLKGFDAALRAFLRDCPGNPDCPRELSTVDGGMARIAELRDRADVSPLTNNPDPTHPVTGSDVLSGIATTLYSKQTWPALRVALRNAFAGDGTALKKIAELAAGRKPDGSWSNQTEANLAIRCTEWPRTTRETAAQAAVTAKQQSPLFGGQVALSWLNCAGWPVEPPPIRRPLGHTTNTAPILVIGTLRDPATPYQWAEALAAHLSNATVLSYDGDGHTAYLSARSSCVDDAVEAYLLDGKVPAPGTRCPAK